jgi:hypothetical protein
MGVGAPLFKIFLLKKMNMYLLQMGHLCGLKYIDLREIGWGGMDWIDLAQDRNQWRALVNTVMNLRVP